METNRTISAAAIEAARIIAEKIPHSFGFLQGQEFVPIIQAAIDEAVDVANKQIKVLERMLTEGDKEAESRPAQEKCPRCEGTRLIQTSDGVANCPNCNAESRPAQEVDEVGKQIVLEIYRNIKTEEEAKAAIEAHKIKAEDTPS